MIVVDFVGLLFYILVVYLHRNVMVIAVEKEYGDVE
jgi:hypothetical protein